MLDRNLKMEKGGASNEFSLRAEKFSEYFPDATIEIIDFESIPENVRVHFEKKSRRFIAPNEYKPEKFDALYIIRHKNGDETWIASQTNQNKEEEILERDHYFVDTKKGESVGHGELRYFVEIQSGQKRIPFVGYTSTYHPPDSTQDYRRQGLGTRRMLYMNGIAQMEYGSPLHSGAHPTDSARSLWENFVNTGKARTTQLEGEEYKRYVFLDQS